MHKSAICQARNPSRCFLATKYTTKRLSPMWQPRTSHQAHLQYRMHCDGHAAWRFHQWNFSRPWRHTMAIQKQNKTCAHACFSFIYGSSSEICSASIFSTPTFLLPFLRLATADGEESVWKQKHNITVPSQTSGTWLVKTKQSMQLLNSIPVWFLTSDQYSCVISISTGKPMCCLMQVWKGKY